MTYINPFELLGISSADAKGIKKAKTKKIAEIQLSEEGYILYGRTEVDKSTLLKIVDELSDPQIKEYHEFIGQRTHLLNFLKSGNTQYFEHFEDHQLYSSRLFLNFIGPYFTDAFQRALQMSFEANDVYMLFKMGQSRFHLVPHKERIGLYSKLEIRVRHIHEALIEQSVKFQYLPKRSGAVLNKAAAEVVYKATEGWKIEVLNALPNQFEDTRTSIAFILKELAFKIYNNYPNNEEYAMELMTLATNLKIRRSSLNEFRRDLRYLSSKLAAKQAHKEELLRIEFREIIDQLRALRRNLEQRSVITMDVVGEIEGLIDFQKVNKAKGLLSNLKNELASEISQIALFVWEKQEDPSLFHSIVNIALKIDLDRAHLQRLSKLKSNTKSKLKKKVGYNFDLLLMAIDGINEKIKLSRHRKNADPDAGKMMTLLVDLFRPDLCVALMKEENTAIKKRVFQNLLPIIHYVRRRNPVAVLEFLDKIEALVKSDEEFLAQIEQIGDQILEDLKNPNQARKEKVKRARVSRDPLEQVSIVQRIQDALYNFKVFLLEENGSGPDRIVQLGLIGGLGGIVLLVLLFLLPALNKNYELKDELASVEPVAFSVESKMKKYEFEERKSEFVGNQLETGKAPYLRCFASSDYERRYNNTARIRNNTLEDAIVVIYTADSLKGSRHAYIRAGETETFNYLPDNEYKFRFYVGKDWNPLKPNFCGLHGAFDTNPRYYVYSRRNGPVSISGGSRFSLVFDPSQERTDSETQETFKQFVSISASGYFYNRNDFPTKEGPGY